METLTPQRVRDYLDGRLDAAAADAVAAALDALPAAEAERLLAGPGHLPPPPQGPVFTSAPRTLEPGPELGRGGMGVVAGASDRVLGREVALKRLRPRGPAEPLERYLARAAAFRREAALTAQLEHPGVVPVHDVGSGPDGEPAFAMKRLDGESLAALVARAAAGDRPDLARMALIVCRVAEAVGFAHSRGVVHRDLKPENVWLGRHGEVTVIDWGLAGRIGEAGARVGTPGWMAPEQERAEAPDPRMDVWALGGLLLAMLGGGVSPDGPRGLIAIARHCRAADPAERYPDGAAVAADLQRWLAAGLTQAERPGVVRRAWARLRRSPALIATACLGLGLGALLVSSLLREHDAAMAAATAELTAIADAPVPDLAAITALQRRLTTLVEEHPGLPRSEAVSARLLMARQMLEDHERRLLLAEALDTLDAGWRVRGPWPGEVPGLTRTLEAAGVLGDDIARAVATLDQHPLHDRLAAALLRLARARLVGGLPPDPRVPQVLARLRESHMRALGRVLEAATVDTHDLAFTPGPDVETALADAGCADLMLSTFGPVERLVQVAEARVAADPGAFWPRVTLARAAVGRGDWAAAERHALVALGREAASLWPRLSLGYTALAQGDWPRLLIEATHAHAANPDHLEAALLQCVALARTGNPAEAERRFRELRADGHLRWHLAHRHGHPMELLADAVVAAGLPLAAAPPRLTPLTPLTPVAPAQ